MKDKSRIAPPGEGTVDPWNLEVEPILFALTRLQVHLMWVDAHRASFEKLRQSDPCGAERELEYLRDSTNQAVVHLQRLTELLLAGYTIDPNKKQPKDLCADAWLGMVETIQQDYPRTSSNREMSQGKADRTS